MVPAGRDALASQPNGMTLEELGVAVGLAGTFQRGKLQQLAQHLIAQGVADAQTGTDGVLRHRLEA